MSTPDYKKYSRLELKASLRQIDRKKYPERAKAIEKQLKHLNNKKYFSYKPKKTETEKIRKKSSKKFKKNKNNFSINLGMLFSLMALLFYFSGRLPSKIPSDHIIENADIRLTGALFFMILAMLFFYNHINKK